MGDRNVSMDGNGVASEVTSDHELEKLVQRVTQKWEERPASDRPYLLSAFGQALSTDLGAIKRLTGLNLTAFLRKHLAHLVEVVRSGEYGNVYALVPPGTGLNMIERLPAAEPRFNPRFWAAFAVPPNGARRLIDATNFSFHDDDGLLTEECDGKLVLDTKLIPAETLPNRTLAVKNQIRNWISEKGLEEQHFLVKNNISRGLASSPLRDGQSVFDLLVSALDKHQLETVRLSLDVVVTLMKRRP